MAESLAPNQPVHRFHLSETAELKGCVAEMTVATLLNWDNRILKIRIGKDIIFYLDHDTPYLQVVDAVAGHMVILGQMLSLLDVPERMIEKIKIEAYYGKSDVIVEQIFDNNSILSKVERLLYGSTRRHWTWRKAQDD